MLPGDSVLQQFPQCHHLSLGRWRLVEFANHCYPQTITIVIGRVIADAVESASLEYGTVASDQEVVANVVQGGGFQVRLLNIANGLAARVLEEEIG